MRAIKVLGVSLFVAAFALTGLAFAADPQEYALTIKDHKFAPAELRVPANTKFKLAVANQDATAEEFESKSMKLEKVIAGGKTASLFVAPLAPGRYPFEGEFHSKTARGIVIAE